MDFLRTFTTIVSEKTKKKVKEDLDGLVCSLDKATLRTEIGLFLFTPWQCVVFQTFLIKGQKKNIKKKPRTDKVWKNVPIVSQIFINGRKMEKQNSTSHDKTQSGQYSLNKITRYRINKSYR